MKNSGAYALVTGATSGIGYELAKLLANDGYSLVLVARSAERLQEVTAEFRQMGVDAVPLEKDLFDPNAATEIYNELKGQGITISVLVNNAGQGEKGLFHGVPMQRHLDVVQLNVTSLVALTHLFLKDMVERNDGKY